MSEDFINTIADNLFANTSQKELSAERIYEVAEAIAPFVLYGAKKELMKDAVDAEIGSAGFLSPLYISDYDKVKNYKYGDKVKLIIIKED